MIKKIIFLIFALILVFMISCQIQSNDENTNTSTDSSIADNVNKAVTILKKYDTHFENIMTSITTTNEEIGSYKIYTTYEEYSSLFSTENIEIPIMEELFIDNYILTLTTKNCSDYEIIRFVKDECLFSKNKIKVEYIGYEILEQGITKPLLPNQTHHLLLPKTFIKDKTELFGKLEIEGSHHVVWEHMRTFSNDYIENTSFDKEKVYYFEEIEEKYDSSNFTSTKYNALVFYYDKNFASLDYVTDRYVDGNDVFVTIHCHQTYSGNTYGTNANQLKVDEEYLSENDIYRVILNIDTDLVAFPINPIYHITIIEYLI
ncbi:MAG: hypothetical protein II980_01530 [Clostridia bacterium]|nr:hypothetical protein [Clostridia bacterium]